ncbi:MAG: aminoacyl--tRNA ligase-related protein [Patescibacteria group bacterium]
MRYSSLFSKATKTVPADSESINAKLLVQAGFVDQEMAGVYTWLPLGLAVLRNIEAIVRDEMNMLGATEIFMPSLQPKEYWETTKRWEGVDVLFKLKSQTGKDYALGCTHEEVVTPLLKKFVQSYKDLPLATYQINTKFRDELRAKSGVLRGREFRMKDMYSFHATQEDLSAFYQKALEAYVRVYDRCGLRVKVVQASGGVFTQNLSHEFQALTDAGEDVLIACDNCEFGENSEIATYKVGDKCPHCQSMLVSTKGIEVGNIFDLGTKYSDAFELDVTNEQGERQRVLMGCYGIGTSRLVGAIVEASHDEKGMVWPKSIAPAFVHLVRLGEDAETVDAADSLYSELLKIGVSVFYDDRDVTAGAKFADADLMGMPLRLTVSKRTLGSGTIEWKERISEESKNVLRENIVSDVLEFMNA